MTHSDHAVLDQTCSGAEFSPWQTVVAVFSPAANLTFDFDAAVYQAIESEHNDNIDRYEIEPVIPGLDRMSSVLAIAPSTMLTSSPTMPTSAHLSMPSS